MRKLPLLALAAPSLFLALAACEGSDSGGATPFTVPESGVFETGTSDSALPDGGVADSALADTFVAPLGVTVTVADAVGPKNNVRVIFHDAAGAVIGETTTDATGKAKVATAPSMVTVLYAPDASRATPVTFTGVADGDNLVVAPRLPFNEAPVFATFSVSFTDGAAIANANFFQVRAGMGFCGNSTNDKAAVVPVGMYAECLAAKNAVLVEASNGGGLLAFGFAKDIVKPAMGATTNVPPLAFTAPGSRQITASNLPAAQALLKRNQLHAIVGTQGFELGNATGTIDTAGGVTYKAATGFADAYQVVVAVESHQSSNSETAIIRREAAAAAADATLANVDFNTALPLITTATVAAPTLARPDVTITPAAALTGADAGVVRLGWYDFETNKGGSWTFVVPANVTTFKAPALPANASAFTPAIAPNIESAAYFDASLVPSYAAAKLLPLVPDADIELADASRPLPAAGTVRVTRYQPIGR